MTDDQKRLNKAIQSIQHVVDGFKGVLTNDQRIQFNQKLDEQFTNLKREFPSMDADEIARHYELFESLKVQR